MDFTRSLYGLQWSALERWRHQRGSLVLPACHMGLGSDTLGSHPLVCLFKRGAGRLHLVASQAMLPGDIALVLEALCASPSKSLYGVGFASSSPIQPFSSRGDWRSAQFSYVPFIQFCLCAVCGGLCTCFSEDEPSVLPSCSVYLRCESIEFHASWAPPPVMRSSSGSTPCALCAHYALHGQGSLFQKD